MVRRWYACGIKWARNSFLWLEKLLQLEDCNITILILNTGQSLSGGILMNLLDGEQLARINNIDLAVTLKTLDFGSQHSVIRGRQSLNKTHRNTSRVPHCHYSTHTYWDYFTNKWGSYSKQKLLPIGRLQIEGNLSQNELHLWNYKRKFSRKLICFEWIIQKTGITKRQTLW